MQFLIFFPHSEISDNFAKIRKNSEMFIFVGSRFLKSEKYFHRFLLMFIIGLFLIQNIACTPRVTYVGPTRNKIEECCCPFHLDKLVLRGGVCT